MNATQGSSGDPIPAAQRRVSDLSRARRRARWLTWTMSFAFVGIAYRGAQLAIEQHHELTDSAKRQQQTKFKLQASRGSIVDRDRATLAVTDEAFRLRLNPRKIREEGTFERVKSALWEIFPQSALRKEIAQHLEMDKAYRMLQHDLTTTQRTAIASLSFEGVAVESVPHRIYPRGRLASHIIGRVNRALEGTLGIERSLDDRLQGHETAGRALRARADAHSGKLKGLLLEGGLDPILSRGHTVALTIDSAIQELSEAALSDLVAEWHPVGASIVILDPKTGEVLAMANQPTFDPNHGVQRSQQVVNLAVQAAYEPGSTIKTFTIAAAIDEGTVTPSTIFDCEKGYWKYTPYAALRDTHRAEKIPVVEILAISSNIGTTKIYETLGKERLHAWLKKFHFGETPSIELPAPASGLLADWKRWSDIQAANISFGQGMSASPLQVAAAFAAIANDGQYLAPAIVKEIVSARGDVVFSLEPKPERILKSSTAQTMMNMLAAVLEHPEGTGKNARVLGYRVAGKTSTAQKAGPKGGYHDDQYYASFVGALPLQDPRAVILVSVDNPEGGHYGNEVAAPTFARLGAALMAHWGIPADDAPDFARPTTHSIELRTPVGTALPTERAEAFPEGEEPALPGEAAIVPRGVAPDFTGLSIREALALAHRKHFDIEIEGSGIATSQLPVPGASLRERTIKIRFSPPT